MVLGDTLQNWLALNTVSTSSMIGSFNFTVIIVFIVILNKTVCQVIFLGNQKNIYFIEIIIFYGKLRIFGL